MTQNQYKFTSLPDYFFNHATLASQSPTGRIGTQPLLGLLDRPYANVDDSLPPDADFTQWGRFARHLTHLNRTAGEGVSYKLLFLVRHGFGVHNEVLERVGREAWDVSCCYCFFSCFRRRV